MYRFVLGKTVLVLLPYTSQAYIPPISRPRHDNLIVVMT